MPINPVMNGGPQAPLEGDTDSGFTGFRFATRAAADRNLGYTAISKVQGELAGGPMVSQKDAISALKAENYDVDGIPAEGMTQGALQARMSRASDIRQSENIAARSGIGTTTQIVAGFAGMLGDPVNIAVAPLGAVTGLARVGLAGRAAIGAAEGAAYMGAYDAGQNAIGPSMGDPDITSHQILKDMMFGGALGGVMHAAFGPRPVAAPGGGPLTLDAIDRLGERSGAYAKAHGISVDDVRSAKGALGRYQVMPDTALQYGATREQIAAGMLRDPTFNKMMAQRVLDDLNKRFPNDPEAVAIAYNAGPGVARRFIRYGRDYNVLPSETRAYAARVVGVPRQVRVDAAKMVVSQASLDAKIDGTKVVDEGMKDHFALRDEGESANIEAPKRDSIFTEDRDLKTWLDAIHDHMDTMKSEVEKPATDTAIDPELAEHVTNDVQQAKDIHERLGNVVKAFHGTDADFKEFDVAKGGKFGAGDAHGAIFFTSNPEIASSYAKFAAKKPKIEVRDTPADGFEPVVSAVDGKTKYVKAGYEETFEGANVRPVKLSFTHPHEVDMKGETYSQRVFGNALAKARIEGHDGVIFRNVNDDVSGKKLSTVYASFNPKEATTPHFGEFEPPEPPVIDGLPAEEHQKGVDAAVRCGMLKGGFS
jgi:hypothetical protein